MLSENIELIQKYIEDDELCKKNIGMDIKNFRSKKMYVNRDTLSRKIDYSFCTLTNVEIGKYYPKIDLLARIANYGTSPLYFVLNQKCNIEPQYDDIRLFKGCTDNQKIDILMKLMFEKYHMINLYNEKIIRDMCVTKSDINRDNVGYLIKAERIKRNVSQKKLAEWLGISIRKMKDIESGNASMPFKKIYFISFLLNVPIDYFLMECIKSKQYIINYLLTEVFTDIDEKEREFYRRYIDVLKYKMNIKG